MKNTKQILSAAFLTAIILPISVSAWHWEWNWWWHWNWHWNWEWNWNWRAEMQNNQEEKKDCKMELPEKQDLSAYEAERLTYQYSEEMVARDAYNYLYDLYWVKTFQKIASAEQKHMDMVKTLLDRYQLEAPAWYWVLQDEFDNLKTEWEKWLKEALEVWVKIEILDINDTTKTMKNVDNDDILTVYVNIWWASYNHLRWFLKALKNNWLETTIDYSNYLNDEEINSKWWVLKVKLAEKLESEWVYLPEWATSKAISEKMEKHWKWHWEWHWKWYWKKSDNNNKKYEEKHYEKHYEKKWNWNKHWNKHWDDYWNKYGEKNNWEKWFFWNFFANLMFWK